MTAPKRRTQAERSAATRERLLAATVDSLYELGFHRTTTASVEQRAGVTRGALQHHFASKQALILATAEYIVLLAGSRLAADAASVPEEDVRGELFNLLWGQFSSPAFLAFMEISMAARTDAELREALIGAQEALDTLCRDAVARLLGTVEDDHEIAMGLELTSRFMRGAAIAMLPGDHPELDADVLRQWQRLMAPFFATATTGRDTTRDGRLADLG